MTITFRTAGPWGAGKGANLTPEELDANFQHVLDEIAAALAAIPEGVSITNVTVSGGQMTIHLSDNTTRGPFTLPRATIRFRGVWEPATAYLNMDVVEIVNVGLYLVLQDHTSDATFDPDRVIDSAPVYQLDASKNSPRIAEA